MDFGFVRQTLLDAPVARSADRKRRGHGCLHCSSCIHQLFEHSAACKVSTLQFERTNGYSSLEFVSASLICLLPTGKPVGLPHW